jgi:hypothetical protein
VGNPFSVMEITQQHVSARLWGFNKHTSGFTLKQKFNELPLAEFWCSLLQEYLTVSLSVIVKLLLFPTTYLVKMDFQCMRPQKWNIRIEWMLHPTWSYQISTITPNFRRLANKRKHHHSSH